MVGCKSIIKAFQTLTEVPHKMKEIFLKEEVYAVVGAAMDVYWHLGRGFLEPVYQEALSIEFLRRRIPFKAQHEIVILYKGVALERTYRADFICYGQVIIELKALEGLCGRDVGQLLNYMKATKFKVGLLINFGSPVRLEWHRYVL
jgi:GxxExxY protein